jgi:hypothetical protein
MPWAAAYRVNVTTSWLYFNDRALLPPSRTNRGGFCCLMIAIMTNNALDYIEVTVALIGRLFDRRFHMIHTLLIPSMG